MLSLVLIVPSAMAQFDITLSVGTDEDVSFADGNQVIYGDATTEAVTIKIMSVKVINSVNNVNLTADPAVASGAALGTGDFTIIAYNAGFFIKRHQQRSTNFKVINATMIPGAGTSSEKRFYIYEDTTARPDVVYYYQIEGVSLDGNRQTLTRGFV